MHDEGCKPNNYTYFMKKGRASQRGSRKQIKQVSVCPQREVPKSYHVSKWSPSGDSYLVIVPPPLSPLLPRLQSRQDSGKVCRCHLCIQYLDQNGHMNVVHKMWCAILGDAHHTLVTIKHLSSFHWYSPGVRFFAHSLNLIQIIYF